MPRRKSGGRSAPRPVARSPSSKAPSRPGRSAARPVARSPSSEVPPWLARPAPRKSGGGFLDGLAWGIGTAVAHRAVDAVVGPRVVKHETVASSGQAAAAAAPNTNSVANSAACGDQSKALGDCLSNYGTDISRCQFYMDMLQECHKSSGATIGA